MYVLVAPASVAAFAFGSATRRSGSSSRRSLRTGRRMPEGVKQTVIVPLPFFRGIFRQRRGCLLFSRKWLRQNGQAISLSLGSDDEIGLQNPFLTRMSCEGIMVLRLKSGEPRQSCTRMAELNHGHGFSGRGSHGARRTMLTVAHSGCPPSRMIVELPLVAATPREVRRRKIRCRSRR